MLTYFWRFKLFYSIILTFLLIHSCQARVDHFNFDLVRTEMTQWIQNSYRITPSLAAARFLWYCRINKIPATCNEVCKDFGISTKRVMQNMSETDYIPVLGGRSVCRQAFKTTRSA